MVYQARLARLKPALRSFLDASGKRSGCPCGIDAKRHALMFLRSMALCDASKSSMYEVPSLFMARGWPGLSVATSPDIERVDMVLVEITGSKSTNLVSRGTLVRKAKSAPSTLFLKGSLPKSTFCVTGRSIMRSQVAPTLKFSLMRYW